METFFRLQDFLKPSNLVDTKKYKYNTTRTNTGWSSYQASVADHTPGISLASSPSALRKPIGPLPSPQGASTAFFSQIASPCSAPNLVKAFLLPTMHPGKSTGPPPVQGSYTASLLPPVKPLNQPHRPLPAPPERPTSTHLEGSSKELPTVPGPSIVLGEDERTLFWNMGRCIGLSTNGTIRITIGRSSTLLLDLLHEQLLSSSRTQAVDLISSTLSEHVCLQYWRRLNYSHWTNHTSALLDTSAPNPNTIFLDPRKVDSPLNTVTWSRMCSHSLP